VKHVKKYNDIQFKFNVGDHVKYKDFYKKIKKDDPTLNDIFQVMEQHEKNELLYYTLNNGKEEILRFERDLKLAKPYEVSLYINKIT
jgi:hypothetical protein